MDETGFLGMGKKNPASPFGDGPAAQRKKGGEGVLGRKKDTSQVSRAKKKRKTHRSGERQGGVGALTKQQRVLEWRNFYNMCKQRSGYRNLKKKKKTTGRSKEEG